MKSIIFGRNPIVEALRAGRMIEEIFLFRSIEKDSRVSEILDLCRKSKTRYTFTERKSLDRMAGTDKHQGVVASVEPITYASVNDLFLSASQRKEKPFFVMLDRIEDPYNLGSIIRNADAAGCHGLIIPRRHASPLTETAVKASSGAIEYVPVCQVNNLIHTLEELKKQGLWIFGLDSGGQKIFTGPDYSIPVCLVIGSEGEGISPVIRKKCDHLVRIPMKGRLSSLNAAVAAGIVMFEVLRQRQTGSA
ncbi:MAG: 23S rRNA (guanosine(2251)-2'-O)-methyltransferase RlmB [Candidatus Aenigmarchaeota archaeon]|nr:23S rRNA (guanosine(2251)-2'-O)-methyltransferase RlmB [Candidatus Aenigmarchaeota archaeon]